MSPAAGPARVSAERFERLYEQSADPWGYLTSDYEREKYTDTLVALPAGPLARVLEVGCSIGAFTQLLAPRCAQLLAIDFAPRALEIARERLAPLRNVELRQAAFPEQAPDGPWNVVVCSEVLYYLDAPALERAIDWIEKQLLQGASVLAVSWRGEGVEEPMSGDQAHERLQARLHGWHAFDGRRPGYRLDRFDGDVA